MKSILLALPLALSLNAQAQPEITYRVAYQSGSKSHKVCGTADNTNSIIRLQDIGEIESKATLHWTTTTSEAVVIQIDEIEGAGKSPLWDKFYNGSLTKIERIRVLKEAIQGIGDATVAHVFPYFYGEGIKKARTWKEFSARIRDAGGDLEYRSCQLHKIDHCIRASSWVPKVLDQHAAENRINLGYTREQIAGVKIITRTEDHSRAAPERNKTLRYAVRFTGFKLLPGECESVTVSYSDRGIEEKMNTAYNVAEATHVSERVSGGRDALIQVTAQGRRAVGVTGNLTRISASGNGITIQKSDELVQYGLNREFAASCRLEATITITAVENKPWYDWGGKPRDVATRNFVVAPNFSVQNESPGDLNYNPQKESLRFETSQVFAAGCPFFNNRPF